MVNAGDIKMNVCRYRIGSYGLLYRYANKSRRKVPSVILLILLPLLFSMPCGVCAVDDKVVRVDPLGTILEILILFTRLTLFPINLLRSHCTSEHVSKFNFHTPALDDDIDDANADECVNFRKNIEKSLFCYSACT